jgi:hypothetical protein
MESTVAPPINPNPHGLFALQLGWKSPIEGSNVGISLTIVADVVRSSVMIIQERAEA